MSDQIIENNDNMARQKIINDGHEFENSSDQKLPSLIIQSPLHLPLSGEEFLPTNTDQFLNSIIPQGTILECDVKIVKGWFGRHLKYNFYHSKTQKLLLSVKKSQCPRSHQFQLSKSENELDFVGTLESNFSGTEFILYSNGLSYKNSKDKASLRKELAFIHYEYQLLKTRKGNLFKAYIPSLIEGQPSQIIPTDENTGLKIKSRFLNKRNQEYFEFKTLEPVWSSKYQSYTLPFNSRVNSASVHNFLLKQLKEDGKLSKEVAIQFGKCDGKYLNIDIAYPFTPLQAFSIIISQLDNKLLI
ncbi:unnamed protein product [Paramecium pentaurelia]|uniref:Tubby C-terminal domain-containing protein n=1 Tax=Paramecium pentaurelia TaxID=43138 RepID=A0A8S1X0C4_9CILI|nr:unnamed protein product [Paramecium pentaurelia]